MNRPAALATAVAAVLTVALVVAFGLFTGGSAESEGLQLAALTVAVLQIAVIMMVATLALNRVRTRAYGWEALGTAVVVTGFAIATGATGAGSDVAMAIRPPIGLIGLLAFALFDTGRPVTRVDRLVTVPAALTAMVVAGVIALTASVTPGAWAALPCTDGCTPYGLDLMGSGWWSTALQSLFAILVGAASLGCIVGLEQRRRRAVGWRRTIMRPLAWCGFVYAGIALLLTLPALGGLATELPTWVEPVLIVRRLLLPLAIAGGMLGALLLQRQASREGMAILGGAEDTASVEVALRGIIGDPDVAVVAPPDDRPCRQGFVRTPLGGPGGQVLGVIEHRPARDGDEEEALALAAPAAALALDRIASRADLRTVSHAERARLERDLHDGAQQHLVALRMRLGLLEARLADGPEDIRDDLDDLVEQAEVALDELRMLARGTHRDELARLGLRGALERAAAGAGVQVDLAGVTDTPMPPAALEAIYFCAREALQNTLKHGPGAQMVVTVSTDGHGVDFALDDMPDHAGIEAPCPVPRTIAERIADAGGSVTARASTGGGRCITGHIPGGTA